MINKPLAGMNICVTGKTITKRAELKRIILESGGSFASAVNDKCTHLIIADPNSQTVKANLARVLGVNLISEDEFFGMVDETEMIMTDLIPEPKAAIVSKHDGKVIGRQG